MVDNASDVELEAIQKLISALEPLDKDARVRVIDYVFRRLGVEGRPAGHDMSFLAPPPAGTPHPPAGSSLPHLNDIRSLKAHKNPQSAIEMAAVAAYYLSEVAPAGHRKPEISASDIEALFTQASFPLRGKARMTLVNTKNAGYLDPGSARGTYRLNPVGYNLVAHKLPSTEGSLTTGNAGGGRKPKRSKKKQTRRKTTKNK